MSPIETTQPVAAASAQPLARKRTRSRVLAIIGGSLAGGGFAALMLASAIFSSYPGGEIVARISALTGDGKAKAGIFFAEIGTVVLGLGVVTLVASAIFALSSRSASRIR